MDEARFARDAWAYVFDAGPVRTWALRFRLFELWWWHGDDDALQRLKRRVKRWLTRTRPRSHSRR